MELKNKRHEAFCRELVIDENQSRAYRVIYPKCAEGSLRANSSKLLTKSNIKERLAELRALAYERNDIAVDEIIGGYKKLVNVCGSELTFEAKDGSEYTKLVDAKNMKGALDSMAKIEGLFVEKVEHDIDISVYFKF